jgi:hypothetical protein
MSLILDLIISGGAYVLFCLQDVYKTEIINSANRCLNFIINLFDSCKIDGANVVNYLSSKGI